MKMWGLHKIQWRGQEPTTNCDTRLPLKVVFHLYILEVYLQEMDIITLKWNQNDVLRAQLQNSTYSLYTHMALKQHSNNRI